MVQNNKYDIVFMDHMMPLMDGIEATQEIRKLPDECYQRLPIIALSANATSEARELFLQAGMDDFIAKPIREKELIACIQERLPEELIQKKEQEAAKVSQEDKAEGTEDLSVIEGLDVAEGIRYCGSQELFVELLGDFYRLIDSKSAKLEEYELPSELQQMEEEKTAFLQNRSTCKRDRNYPLKMQSEVISSRLDTPHIFMVSSSSDPIFSM